MKPYLICTLVITFCLFAFSSIAQGDQPQKIALDLFFASGAISAERPKVDIVAGLDLPIKIDQENHLIQMGEKALASCNKAMDSLNAIASVLAPAIVELYREEVSQDQQITESALIGYMGGFQTLNEAAQQLWTNLYQTYPKLAEGISVEARIAQMTTARQELDQFVPIFELANYFTLVGNYDYAGKYFEKIKTRFPSREIYSNAGVCKALQALNLFGINELKYVYPFVIDIDSRAGQKGEKEMREQLLESAAEDFRESIRRDPNYAIGYVNLSCTQSLLQNYAEAIANAQKAEDLAKTQSLDRVVGSALIAKGIAYAESGDQVQSDAAFATAAHIEDDSVQQLVKLNQQEEVSTGEENTFWDEEMIGSSTLESIAAEIMFGDDLQEPFSTIQAGENMELIIKEETHYQLIKQQDSTQDNLWFFQTSKPGYDGKSAGEIQLDADITEVTDAYGHPAVTRKFGRGKFYYYEQSGIIFKINEDNEVEAWTLFYYN